LHPGVQISIRADPRTLPCVDGDSVHAVPPQTRAHVVPYCVPEKERQMDLSLTEDIKSVSEFKKQIREVFTQLHRTGRPVVITVNGRPDVVLLDAAVFERKLSDLNLRALLAEGEADVAAGRTRSARAAVRALRRAKN